jgi:hypothetical protein
MPPSIQPDLNNPDHAAEDGRYDGPPYLPGHSVEAHAEPPKKPEVFLRGVLMVDPVDAEPGVSEFFPHGNPDGVGQLRELRFGKWPLCQLAKS